MFSNAHFNRLLLEFIHILERRLIDLLLHDAPELAIDQIEVRAVGDHRSGDMKSEVSRSITVRSLREPMRWCAVLLKHERVTSDAFDSRKYCSK